jgi:hypothetical protein
MEHVLSELESATNNEDVARLVDIMRGHEDQAEIQERVSGAIHYIALDGEQARELIWKNGGFQAVCDGMALHPQEARLQEKGCGLLAILALCKERAMADAHERAIETILAAITAHPSNMDVLERGFEALRNWSSAQPSIACKTLAGKKCVSAIVQAMVRHKESDLIVESGCQTLCTLSASGGDSARDILKEIDIEQIVAAMSAHRAEGRVSEWACALLAQFASQIEEAHLGALLGICLDALLGAMRANPDQRQVQEHCFSCLRVFSAVQSCASVVVSAGCLDLVADALSLHTQAPDLEAAGMSIICELAKYVQRVSEAYDEGVVRALLTNMAQFPRNVQALRLGLEALQHACLQQTSRQVFDQCAKEAALQIIIRAMDTHFKDADLQGMCISVISMLTSTRLNVVQETLNRAKLAIHRAALIHSAHKDTAARVLATLHSVRMRADNLLEQREWSRKHGQCAHCDKTAKDAGVEELLCCTKCTLAPNYCSESCKSAAKEAHKKECRANSVVNQDEQEQDQEQKEKKEEERMKIMKKTILEAMLGRQDSDQLVLLIQKSGDVTQCAHVFKAMNSIRWTREMLVRIKDISKILGQYVYDLMCHSECCDVLIEAAAFFKTLKSNQVILDYESFQNLLSALAEGLLENPHEEQLVDRAVEFLLACADSEGFTAHAEKRDILTVLLALLDMHKGNAARTKALMKVLHIYVDDRNIAAGFLRYGHAVILDVMQFYKHDPEVLATGMRIFSDVVREHEYVARQLYTPRVVQIITDCLCRYAEDPVFHKLGHIVFSALIRSSDRHRIFKESDGLVILMRDVIPRNPKWVAEELAMAILRFVQDTCVHVESHTAKTIVIASPARCIISLLRVHETSASIQASGLMAMQVLLACHNSEISALESSKNIMAYATKLLQASAKREGCKENAQVVLQFLKIAKPLMDKWEASKEAAADTIPRQGTKIPKDASAADANAQHAAAQVPGAAVTGRTNTGSTPPSDKQSDQARSDAADVCVVCNARASEKGLQALLKCKGCTVAPKYCSVKCQKDHWSEHKAVCKANKRTSVQETSEQQQQQQ